MYYYNGKADRQYIYIATPERRLVGVLNGVEETSARVVKNAQNTFELSFDVYRYVDGEPSTFYENIEELMQLYVDGTWYIINDPPRINNDGMKSEYMSVTAESAEIQLQHFDLQDFAIGMGTPESYEMQYYEKYKDTPGYKYKDSWPVVRFYNPDDKELSLLHLILYHAGIIPVETTYDQDGNEVKNWVSHADEGLWKIGKVDYHVKERKKFPPSYVAVTPEASHLSEYYEFIEDETIENKADFGVMWVDETKTTATYKFRNPMSSEQSVTITVDYSVTYGDRSLQAGTIKLNQNRKSVELSDGTNDCFISYSIDNDGYITLKLWLGDYDHIPDCSIRFSSVYTTKTYSNTYVKTQDKTIDSGKTYYQMVDTETYWLGDESYAFQIENQDVYSFLTQDVSQAFSCIFIFDTVNMTINATYVENIDKINIGNIGKDTNVYIGWRNIQDNLTGTRQDQLYTSVRVAGGEGVDNILYANFGSFDIEDYSYFMDTKYVSQGLIDRYNAWVEYRERMRPSYVAARKRWFEADSAAKEIESRVPTDGVENDWSGKEEDELKTAYDNYSAIIQGLENSYVDEDGNFDIEALKASTDWALYEQIVNYILPSIVSALHGTNSAIEGYGNGNLLNNAYFTTTNSWRKKDSQTILRTFSSDSLPTFGAVHYLHATRRNPRGYWGVYQNEISVLPGNTYMLSAWVKTPTSGKVYLVYSFNDQYLGTCEVKGFTTSNKWQRVYTKITTPSSDVTHTPLIAVGVFCDNNVTGFDMCAPMLELGNLSSPSSFGYFQQEDEVIQSYKTDWKLYGTIELQNLIDNYSHQAQLLEDFGYHDGAALVSGGSDSGELFVDAEETTATYRFSDPITSVDSLSIRVNYIVSWGSSRTRNTVVLNKDRTLFDLSGGTNDCTISYSISNDRYVTLTLWLGDYDLIPECSVSFTSTYATSYEEYSDEERLYQQYLDYLSLREEAINALEERKAELAEQERLRTKALNDANDIATAVDRKNFLTAEDIEVLLNLYKHNDYINENIVVTYGMDTDTEVDQQWSLWYDATDNLYALSHPQYSWEDKIENILGLEEFKDITTPLDLFSFVHVEIDDDGTFATLRLIGMTYNPLIYQGDYSLKFSTITKYKNRRDDFSQLLGGAIKAAKNAIIGEMSNVTTTYAITPEFVKQLLSNATFQKGAGSIANTNGYGGVGGNVSFDKINANVIVTKLLEADEAYIADLTAGVVTADSVTTTLLNAEKAYIDDLSAKIVTSESVITSILTADSGYIETLTSNLITAQTIDAALVVAKKAEIDDISAKIVTADTVAAAIGEFTQVQADSVFADYAKIDFANIDTANINVTKTSELIAKIGMVTDLTVEDGHITGKLSGVEIDGDVINVNNIRANSLFLRGDDGLYYALNVNALGEATVESLGYYVVTASGSENPSECNWYEFDGENYYYTTDTRVNPNKTYYGNWQDDLKEGLHGENIIAGTITANKIYVSDLSAFRATIGGLMIDADAIHTTGKNSVDSAVAGLYMDNDGQFNTGDATNFIASWYDDTTQRWKVAIRADEISFGTGESVKDVVTGAANKVDELEERMDSGEFIGQKGDSAINVVIDSSAGNIFKNGNIATILTCTVYSGYTDITSEVTQFKWMKYDQNGNLDENWTRTMAGNTIQLTNRDVQSKAKFTCEVSFET